MMKMMIMTMKHEIFFNFYSNFCHKFKHTCSTTFLLGGGALRPERFKKKSFLSFIEHVKPICVVKRAICAVCWTIKTIATFVDAFVES